jgi:hypothetical protein
MPVDTDDDKAPAPRARVLQAFRTLSGQHPKRPERMSRGEPVVLRAIAPLALLVMAAIVVCTGLGYVLARQADDYLEAEHRQALAGAVEALQAVSPDLASVEPKLIRVLERASGLKELRSRLSRRRSAARSSRCSTATGASSAGSAGSRSGRRPR